jgi:hypothetical protein
MSRTRAIPSAFVAVFVLGLVSSAVQAQIIYEPVRYQYGGQNPFYYGGSDPRVIDYASGPTGGGGWWGRVHGFDFISGDYQTHRDVTNEGYRSYSDAIGYQNGRLWGFTDNDARNEAYANAPTYFRKSDLLHAAVRNSDGSWTVPAQLCSSGPRFYGLPDNSKNASTGPTTTPHPLMIIPKRALERQDPPAKLTSAN